MKAIEALASLNSAERLMEVARKLDKGDRKGLSRCAELLQNLGQTAACSEIYGKMGDWKSLIELYSKSDQWDEAFALANRNPELAPLCWTLRADWLAERDLFIEAQQESPIFLYLGNFEIKKYFLPSYRKKSNKYIFRHTIQQENKRKLWMF